MRYGKKAECAWGERHEPRSKTKKEKKELGQEGKTEIRN